ncbi:hypothetical protein V1281_004982 [Nitrobacteraceae bacterium AZCC 2161]
MELGCGACGRGSHPRTREVGGNRPGPLPRLCRCVGWTGAGKAGESLPDEGQSPLVDCLVARSRKHGPSNRKAAMARRKATRAGCSLSQAGFGARLATQLRLSARHPPRFGGGKLEGPLCAAARNGRRVGGFSEIGLFDNCIGELTRPCPGCGAAWRCGASLGLCRSADPGSAAMQNSWAPDLRRNTSYCIASGARGCSIRGCSVRGRVPQASPTQPFPSR